MELKELIGKDLQGYAIEELYEVYRVNEDGKKFRSIGYFRSGDIATAFAGNQTDAVWHKTAKAFVLTNGTDGFLMTGQPVKLLGDEQAMLDIRNAAKAKLTEAEQRVLGLL